MAKPAKKDSASQAPDHPMDSATPPDGENIDKIRDILFGSQSRQIEKKLSAVEEKIDKEIDFLRSETKTTLEAFEQFVRKERPKLADVNDAEQPVDDLERLRRIIVGPEKTRIHRLEKRLDELSRVLPDAIARCTAKDQKLARSLQPTIEASIRVSVQKNPEVLADAVFPLMGPGIRKAIASIEKTVWSFSTSWVRP